MARPIITLLTDFGVSDTFVGQMKGVLLSHSRDAVLVDLTHDIPAQAITCAAFHLAAAWASFPVGTVHLAVVDPGVGTQRRAVALRYDRHYFVVPDNGLISAVLGLSNPECAVELPIADRPNHLVSRTFHGRDVFAQAAGRLAAGTPLDLLGTRVAPDSIQRLDLPLASRRNGDVRGEIVIVDHFGNCMTNIPHSMLPEDLSRVTVRCSGLMLRGVSQTYQDAKSGVPLALISSMQTLELALCNGSAAREYGLKTGMAVTLSWDPESGCASHS